MALSSPQGRVYTIYVAPEAGGRMDRRFEVDVSMSGIVGDRYEAGVGSFSKVRKAIRHITLIGLADIGKGNLAAGVEYTGADTRRNIVTGGIELPSLIGVRFSIGGVALRGVEPCTPCDRPDNLLGRERRFKEAFHEFGGIRAKVLVPGKIRVGDDITVDPNQEDDIPDAAKNQNTPG